MFVDASIVAQIDPPQSIGWNAAWIGNTITAIATVAAVWLTQGLARGNERRTRWSDRKRLAYSDFIFAMLQLNYSALEVAGQPSPIRDTSGHDWWDEFISNWNALRLLAPQKVFDAATKAFNEADNLQKKKEERRILGIEVTDDEEDSRDAIEGADQGIREQSERASRAVNEFIDRAREDLGEKPLAPTSGD